VRIHFPFSSTTPTATNLRSEVYTRNKTYGNKIYETLLLPLQTPVLGRTVKIFSEMLLNYSQNSVPFIIIPMRHTMLEH